MTHVYLFYTLDFVAKFFPALTSGDLGLIPGSGRSSEGGNGTPTPELLSEKSQGHRNLAGYNLGLQRIRHD